MKKQIPKPAGLSFVRRFTQEGKSPYALFNYERRSSVIKNPNGDVIAQVNEVEVPVHWSQIATDILAQKYVRRAGVPQADGSLGAETSVKQVVHRLANCWRNWGNTYGYFKTNQDALVFYDELVFMLLGQYAAPNSPQWFNTGLYESYGITEPSEGHFYVDPETQKVRESSSSYERPQPHACFILSAEDTLTQKGGIMDLLTQEARVFKYGSGVGTNYSKIRGKDEPLSGGGTSSGLLSFLKIGDRAAGAIKSGGTTRRAAKMVSLNADHPEIEAFINWKKDEERKVAALIDAGYSADYEGEAYQTVSGQNSNNSVRLPDSFFEALHNNQDWPLKARTTGETMTTLQAQDLWKQINEAAWACADPALQFDTTINDWHTCPADGRINASNPCSEYMFLDNTACNLASLNLLAFYHPETQLFDTEAFTHACRLWSVVLEISVLMAQFPSEEVALRSYQYRTIGLGYANLGALLMVQGLPYDSAAARAQAAGITSLMTGAVYQTSAELAQAVGPFARYAQNRDAMLRVLRNHQHAAHNRQDQYEGLHLPAQGLDQELCPENIRTAAHQAWEQALNLGEKHGFRNAQATVIAPTGTIGLLMDCDTTGVEPDFALVKFKKLAGGGYFKIINQSIPMALQRLGYSPDQILAIVNYAKGHATLQGVPHLQVQALLEKGLLPQEIEKIETALPTAYDLNTLFSAYTLGEECLGRLGFTPDQVASPNFQLLRELGFTASQLHASNDYLFGTMTLEGAPYLQEEHYAVFDCANRCGHAGTRFIHPMGHIKMMAAVQPFISGAISKTINLPHETTVDEIAFCNETSWKMGLKACSLYRDGSKLSQPLTTKKDSSEEAPEDLPAQNQQQLLHNSEQVLQAAQAILADASNDQFRQRLSHMVERRKLPDKRTGFTQKAKIDGHTVYIRTGEYADGSLGEVFIDMYKEGASFRSILNCFAISVSLGLQYGVPLEAFVNRFTFTRFEPAGRVEHPNIKQATSVFDYLFRLLAHEYLGRTDLVHVPTPLVASPSQAKEAPTHTSKAAELSTTYKSVLSMEAVPTAAASVKGAEQAEQILATYMGDAPICPTCGHLTIRSGTCYKCLNCGNSLGCS
ncbi:vitamin B12-dependent ribonucleotide reductase [Nibribacter koreensis]|uniref:Vitamin B12-dependent ribonucleotide reductase n=1 Tax=Nibribacter koreensis TaxID=1084519 RepID=A0ABP8FD57_9BACT